MGDVFDVIDYPWDLMIAHPPCTHLSVSGARHFATKQMDGRQQEAVSFFMRLIRRSEHIKRTAIENPVCIMSSLYRKPDQIIQPWQFGHGETKATCLWLKGLPRLKPTQIVAGRTARVHRMAPGPDRWKERSKTYQGIGDAMAAQWGALGVSVMGLGIAVRVLFAQVSANAHAERARADRNEAALREQTAALVERATCSRSSSGSPRPR